MKKGFVVFFIVLSFGILGCQKYHQTQQNLKEYNQIIPPRPKTKVPRFFVPQKKLNIWHAPVTQAANLYKNESEDMRDLRNFKLSEKYSEQALLWAKRAEEIKPLSSPEARIKLKEWLDALTLPDLPHKPRYFKGQDAFEAINKAYQPIENIEDRLCAIFLGIPFLEAFGQLVFAIDQMADKHYGKAIIHGTGAYGRIQSPPNLQKSCSDWDKE